jgi:hypothetical protein
LVALADFYFELKEAHMETHTTDEAVPRRLLRRSQLDGRTTEAKAFDRLVTNVERDMGGADKLTAVERSLVEAFCGARIMVDVLNAKLARGDAVAPSEHSQATSTLMRLATRLGLQRRIVATEGDTL